MASSDHLREKAARVRRMAAAIGDPADAMAMTLQRLSERYDALAKAVDHGTTQAVAQRTAARVEPVGFVSAAFGGGRRQPQARASTVEAPPPPPPPPSPPELRVVIHRTAADTGEPPTCARGADRCRRHNIRRE
jgi:hypothetical protein